MTVSALTLGATVPGARSAQADPGVTAGEGEQARAGVTFASHDSLEQLSPQTKHTWWAVVVDNATSKSSIIRTVDSGARWQNVTPPVSRFRVGSLSGDFLNAEIGWVVIVPLSPSASRHAEAVVRTLDGGRSWKALGTVPYGCELDFVDRNDGWCSVLGAAMGSESVWLYCTLDSGGTWNLVSQTAAPPATSTPGALSFGCDKDVTFTSPTVGWVSTACAAGVPYLYTSDDGGAHWQQLPHVPVPAVVSTSGGWDMDPPVVAGSEVAVALTIDGEHGVSAVATSPDGGRTWRTQEVPGLRQPAMVDVVDPTHFIGTDGTVLVATDDRGSRWNRWKPAVTLKDAQGTPLTLDFLSPILGWAVSRAAGGPLWWTTDGGRIWRPITLTTSS
jgi:hypothetical protein